jgi:peptidoglycan/xylan/chitin deacetylase (PgdA/CDA1 family)
VSSISPLAPARPRFAPRAGRVVNITFHGVGPVPRELPPGEAAVWLELDRFERILDAVAGRDDVALFFDDGNASDLELALPALQSRGLAATFAPIAGRLGQPGFLAAGGLPELAGAGMTIASHGLEHRRWRGLSGAELEAELVDGRRAIEAAAGVPVTHAACPFGAYDRRVLAALRRLGYTRVFTSDEGPARRERRLQPRTSIRRDHDDAAVERILSGRAPAAQRARRALRLAAKRWR